MLAAPPADIPAVSAPATSPSAAAENASPVYRKAWVRFPTAGDFASVYPPKEVHSGATARVVLTCDTGADGWLSTCAITSETPPGRGFGEAALHLATKFRLRPPLPSEVGYPATVDLPIGFQVR